ncbi:formamidase [Folsomia candida]|uniref:Formamidase n=1 Tax=Folsomia candida TaxID=158441 RepID=A0A226E1V2_FOLCA|nr:formamidase [Folsomia candida]OXA51533.1 Formamidase [Folsomia candida]
MRTVVKIDLTKTAMEESRKIFHNRYHPEIPPVDTVKAGEVFKVECFDFSGGQIKNDDDAADIKNMDLSVAHILSGPIAVEGAEPGDAVEVELLDIQPFPERAWGVTAVLDPNNGGGGFLGDVMKGPCKAIWDFEGIYASSRHIPGVRFVGMIHTGIIATAPSHQLLAEWNRREGVLIASAPNHQPPLAFPPSAQGALVGGLEGTPLGERVKVEGARTAPTREHGGNCDIKNLSRGAKIWIPVYVPGANLSFGDIHFSQGDGEIAFCGGIETSGIVTCRVQVIKRGVDRFALKNPIFLPGPVEPRYTKYLTFQGIPVDRGIQHFLDPRVAFRQACLNAVAYLQRLGYTAEQAYLILSAAPCESRINNIVDVPNSCCSIGIPAEIFDFDILPRADEHVRTFDNKALATLRF